MIHLTKKDLQALEHDLVDIWDSFITTDAPEKDQLQETILALPSLKTIEDICLKRHSDRHMDDSPDSLAFCLRKMHRAYLDENALYYLALLIREVRATINDLGILRVEWFNIED